MPLYKTTAKNGSVRMVSFFRELRKEKYISLLYNDQKGWPMPKTTADSNTRQIFNAIVPLCSVIKQLSRRPFGPFSRARLVRLYNELPLFIT